ncbi:MAG: HD domain-containing protein [Lachnospiraceae bacterium]|nr:HD domain-containing protein [Lachnospiraceae bacterium]
MTKIKSLRRIIAVLTVLTLFIMWEAPVSHAQTDLSGLSVGQTMILYDSSIGMPTSEANTVVQTKNGFIWIGSYSGLVRYDGNNFYRYDSTTGITSVVSLFVDEKDRLWIGTNDNGLALFEKGEFKFLHVDDGLPASSIRAIGETGGGKIIIGTTEGMVYVDEDFTVKKFDDTTLDGKYVYNLESAADGNVYGVTYDGEVFMINDEGVPYFYTADDMPFDGYIYSICPDDAHPGYAFIGNNLSDIYYGDVTNGFNSYQSYTADGLTSMNALYEKDDTLWVGAGEGIGYIKLKNRKCTKLDDGVISSSVEDIMEDQEGNLWYASSRQGVIKLTTSIFADINRINGMEDTVTNTTCLYNNMLYIGTDNGLIILDTDYSILENDLTKMLSGLRIRSIKKDSKDNLWLCTYSDYGLICIQNDGTMQMYNKENGMLSDRPRTVSEMSNGIIAVALSGGVQFIKDGKINSTYTSEDGLSSTDALSICENATAKELYLGTDGDGLYILPETEDEKDIVHMGLADGLTSEVILRVKYDKYRDVYWMVTSNSIAYMKDRKITTITNFPYANNFDIFFDEHGNLWVLSSNGIYVVDAEEMMENPDNFLYTLYNSDSGLPHVATANSRSYIGEDGNLFIAGTTGITRVNINDELEIKSAHLDVPFIAVDDEMVYLDENREITIPSSCQRLTIYGYSLSYALNNPRIQYYLEGFDKQPFNTTKRDLSEVTYTNLDGGTYTFHLKTVTADADSDEEITVKIHKERALYEYWWFDMIILFILALMVILLIYLRFRRKNKALLKKQEETKEFINQITQAFAKCIDAKDRYTNGHSFRVANYTRMLAQKMGYTESEVDDFYNTALLHDIGKLSIPDAILNKPEGLDDEEYAVMKSHAEKGQKILEEIKIAPDLAIGAGYHHERLDGRGYPHGCTAEEIPMVAQIIAVADTFDAMYSTRPYRKKMPIQTVLDELHRVAGTQLNAEVVEKLQELKDEGSIV